MRYITLLICLFLFLLASVANAATYYVDHSVGCNDSGAGSEGAPWCHSPGMPSWIGSATLSAGDTVYFDSADTWTETSGDYVLNIQGGVTYIGDTWGSGTRAKLVAGADMAFGMTVRFRADHATYETEIKGFEIDAGGDNDNSPNCPRTGSHYANDGISMNMGHDPPRTWDPPVPLVGATKRIRNCVVYNTWSCTTSSEYMYGIIIRSLGGVNYTVENVEILDNLVYNQSRTCITIYPFWDVGSKVSNVLIRGNEAHTSGYEPGYSSGWGLVVKDNVSELTAEYNYFHGSGGATGGTVLISSDLAGTNNTNIVIRYNILGTTTSPNHVYIPTYGNLDLYFYGNIIYNSSANHYGILFTTHPTNSIDAYIYNNTFYNTTLVAQTSSATKTIDFRNNLMVGTTAALLSDPNSYITTHGYNTFYRSDGGTLVSSGGNSYTSANLTTYEATALSSNPLLTNASDLPTGWTGTYAVNLQPNPNGLSLQSGSPSINSGVNLGSPYNGSINTITRTGSWDRGAYELYAGATVQGVSFIGGSIQ